MTSFTASGKPKRTIESLQIERRYSNVLTLFLSGQLPSFTHQRHVHVANILRRLQGQATRPFRYRDLGNLATIGRNSAVADIRGLRLTGFIAWLTWAGVHILNLIGFRNRILVALQWLWQYLTFQRGARLITGANDEM